MSKNNRKTAIEAVNIRKEFNVGGTANRVLKDLSLEVMQGEFVSIMGSPVPEKVPCYIFWGDLISQRMGKF